MKTETLSVAEPYLIEQNYKPILTSNTLCGRSLWDACCLNWKSTQRANIWMAFRSLACERTGCRELAVDQRAAGATDRMEFHAGERISSGARVF